MEVNVDNSSSSPLLTSEGVGRNGLKNVRRKRMNKRTNSKLKDNTSKTDLIDMHNSVNNDCSNSDIFSYNEDWEITNSQEVLSNSSGLNVNGGDASDSVSDCKLQARKLCELNKDSQPCDSDRQQDKCSDNNNNRGPHNNDVDKECEIVENENNCSSSRCVLTITKQENRVNNNMGLDITSCCGETDRECVGSCDWCGNMNQLDDKTMKDCVVKNRTGTRSTDFCRFKAVSVCEEFPPSVWKSIEDGDLESLAKHMEKAVHNDSINVTNVGENGRTKRGIEQICDADKESVGTPSESKRIRLDNDGSSSLTENGNSHAVGETEPVQIRDECYVAFDCEMVGIGPKGSQSVLGRCSIIDYQGNVIYDKYVRSIEPITDFRTRWSGIRPRHMKKAEPLVKALLEIRQCLKNKIVIGHSVWNDFKVVFFEPHRYLIRDIARCPVLSRMANLDKVRQGNSLKSLSQKILGKQIQNGKNGHDSVEDATATLELFKVARSEWEKELFTSWRKEGLDVSSFIADLNKKVDVSDNKGRAVTDFDNKKVITESELSDLVSKRLKSNSKVGGTISDDKFSADFLSDQYWPSDL